MYADRVMCHEFGVLLAGGACSATWHARAGIELPIGQRAARFRQREANQIRSRVASKRIGLCRPVHVAKRGGVTVEVMFCPLVVGDDHLCGRGFSLNKAGSYLADRFSKNHDEQLKCDNPATSKNSDGFSR